MKTHSIVILLISLFLSVARAQIRSEHDLQRAAQQGRTPRTEELVSFKEDVPYNQAIQGLGELIKKLTGKIVVDNSPMKDKDKKIGTNIVSMYWKDAFELILRSNQVWYVERPDFFEIVSPDQAAALRASLGSSSQSSAQPMGGALPGMVDSTEILAKMREVIISAIFLEVNQTLLRQVGIDLSIFRGSDLNLGIQFSGATAGVANKFPPTITANPSSNRLAVDISTAIKFIETEGLGEVLSRPQVSVRTGSTGFVQIGQDFSTRSKDFQGNTIERFFPTGTILTVTPKLYKYGDTEFIVLSLSIERSTVDVGAVSTIVNKTNATSTLTLLNGEESYVGGLYVNEETSTREGVPLLKDLPWWVFGLRYIFGWESKSLARRELIVLIKADLVPTLEERAAQRNVPRNMLQERLQNNQRDIEQRRKKN